MSIRYLTDINLLLYAHHPGFAEHAAAKQWLTARLSNEGFAMPWLVALGFVRISCNPAAVKNATSRDVAWAKLSDMLDTQRVWLVEPDARHRQHMQQLMSLAGQDKGDLTDLHLAALAIEHRLTLCSTDQGFARFEPAGLRWKNPLI